MIGVDVNAGRRAVARRMGADSVLDPTEVDVVEEVKRMTGGSGRTWRSRRSGPRH